MKNFDYYGSKHSETEARMRDLSAGLSYTIPKNLKSIAVKVIYPFGGAAARVVFEDIDNPKISVSTYLDVDNRLGFFGGPHFEIYPDENGGNTRFSVSEEADMYKAVIASIRQQRKSQP